MSKYFAETMEIMGKIETKLDLMLELIEAKKVENWTLVDEIGAKLDSMKVQTNS